MSTYFRDTTLVGCGAPEDAFRLYTCNGTDLRDIPGDEYDFVMSTIVLQHIAVHEIRFNYLRELFRVMRPGGLWSFQMGFGEGWGKAGYYENRYDAKGTNSRHDTLVTDPAQVEHDLERIGFQNVAHVIRPSFDDGHPLSIYVKARKPGDADATWNWCESDYGSRPANTPHSCWCNVRATASCV